MEAARVAGATRAVVREAVMDLISAPFLSSSRSFQPLPLEQWRHKTPLITGKDKINPSGAEIFVLWEDPALDRSKCSVLRNLKSWPIIVIIGSF